MRPDVIYRFQFQRKTGPFFLGDTAQPFTVTRVAKAEVDGGRPRHDGAEQHRPALDAELPLACGEGRDLVRRRRSPFAGQRDDPFYADIGAIFDLVAIRKGTGNQGGGKDFFAGYAVHTFAASGADRRPRRRRTPHRRLGLRRPAQGHDPRRRHARLGRVGAGQPPRQPARQRGDHPDRAQGRLERGAAVERVGVPEVLRDADPRRGDQQAVQAGRPETGRDDLVAVLLTGVPKLNYTGAKLADVLRLNLSIPVTASPKRLGVLAGDNQGWPNGRRLGDDVIDIAEQAVAGFLKGKKVPLGDGVDGDDRKLLPAFPYIADPQSGFDNTRSF